MQDIYQNLASRYQIIMLAYDDIVYKLRHMMWLPSSTTLDILLLSMALHTQARAAAICIAIVVMSCTLSSSALKQGMYSCTWYLYPGYDLACND